MRGRGLGLLILIFIQVLNLKAQEINKPFVLQHMFHKHKIDFINATVFQNMDSYSAVYNTTHLLLRWNLDENDFVFFNISKTFGDGITKKLEREGFSIYSTGDDLESYLKNINRTGRKYLLEFFYQREFKNFIFTVGLLDTTSFIDGNRYANDEHTQFLNPILINNPIALLPSYNPGISIHYNFNSTIGLTTVYIEDKDNIGDVGIVQLEIEKDRFSFRPYYFYLFGDIEYKGFGLSQDFKINDNFGLFSRIGNSTGDYEFFISGGFEIKNILKNDKVGLGGGYIFSNNDELSDYYAVECYYLINLLKHLSITFDIQQIGEKKAKLVYGFRFYIYF